MKHRVVIVDDHLLIAKAIGSIIDTFRHFQVTFEAENGKVLQDRLKQPNAVPDIVLLDVSMPVMDGFATASWLKTNFPSVLILALSVQDDDETLIRMIKCGARGYLHKNVHPAELEKALQTLVKSGIYYPEWASNRVLLSLAGSDASGDQPDQAISNREKEFLQFACTDLTYREIGEKMFCSARTVESYRDSLFEKLSVNSRVALALYAVKHGIYKL